jgi:hypothetical protein
MWILVNNTTMSGHQFIMYTTLMQDVNNKGNWEEMRGYIGTLCTDHSSVNLIYFTK